MKFERKCVLCHSSYSYCPTCQDYIDYPRWMNLFCSSNCHELYLTLNDYYAKHSTREDTLAKLNELDLSKYDSFAEPYKRAINGVLDSENN